MIICIIQINPIFGLPCDNLNNGIYLYKKFLLPYSLKTLHGNFTYRIKGTPVNFLIDLILLCFRNRPINLYFYRKLSIPLCNFVPKMGTYQNTILIKLCLLVYRVIFLITRNLKWNIFNFYFV